MIRWVERTMPVWKPSGIGLSLFIARIYIYILFLFFIYGLIKECPWCLYSILCAHHCNRGHKRMISNSANEIIICIYELIVMPC